MAYSLEEIEYMKNNHDKMFVNEIANYLNKNCCNIKTKMKKMGLSVLEKHNEKEKNILVYNESYETILERHGRKITKNLKKIIDELKVGQTIEVQYEFDIRDSRNIKGIIIGKYKTYIRIKCNDYIQTLNYTDFYTNVATIKSIE